MKPRALPALGIVLLLAASARAAESTNHPATVKANRTNIRAKPSFEGEVLATLNKGDTVNTLEEVSGTGADGAPRPWFRIAMPSAVGVWIYSPLVDKAANAIKAEKANFRAGPGRNYTELGSLTKGAKIAVLREMDDWVQVEPPAGASAFVAASLLALPGGIDSAATPLPVATNPPPPRPLPPAPAKAPSPLTPAAPTTPASTNIPTATVPAEVDHREPLVRSSNRPRSPAPPSGAKPRDVLRQGILRPARAPQAPADFELVSLHGEGLLDYVAFEGDPSELAKFNHRQVYIIGGEWREPHSKTPVVRVRTIKLAN